MSTEPDGILAHESSRRRTFAIISHPDAGKTTLTEKFLLYGGAVNLAGSVTARKNQRAATSDWLELERKRGISVSSTVLQFDYQDYRVNLLDTPGHNDFSEDTYRVLTAVDAVIMVIDAGKGIESQTRKLFEVCRHRQIPIYTFINKLDRPSREPLELLDQLEKVLGIATFPVNWPLGTGGDFIGVWDRIKMQAHLFERTPGGAQRAPVQVGRLTDPIVRERLNQQVYERVCEDLAILDGAGAAFDAQGVLAGSITPVYFGSALNNFGVQLLLDGFLEHATPPTARPTIDGHPIEPTSPFFSGFVFKIQANMDPRHRDRVAFVRIVSGKFCRNMSVTHSRSGRTIRLANASKIFGSERESIEWAYAGDVIGIVGNSLLAIGDTLTDDPTIVYDEIPFFPPEIYMFLENSVPSQIKRFQAGLAQLLQEGVIQVYEVPQSTSKTVLLGAAGPLQFEVVQYRLEAEYGAKSDLRAAPWKITRWLEDAVDPESIELMEGVQLALDGKSRRVLLFEEAWALRYFSGRNPTIKLGDLPF